MQDSASKRPRESYEVDVILRVLWHGGITVPKSIINELKKEHPKMNYIHLMGVMYPKKMPYNPDMRRIRKERIVTVPQL